MDRVTRLLPPHAAIVVGQDALPVTATAPLAPTLPDVVTLASYGLGLWWCLGGPTWAGVASMLGDELDGRLARATKQTSERGGHLDWGADVALTPLALLRLGKTVGNVPLAMAAAPPLLLLQADMRARGERPAIGSARAAIMIAAMIAEKLR